MTHVRLSRVHHPVEVLGPGQRVGIWLQGCTIGCPGCLSRDTWDPDAGRSVPTTALVDAVTRLTAGSQVDGVTITGGEPFEQAGALRALIPQLRDALRDRAPEGGIDVLVYSGLRSEVIHREHADVLTHIDVLIPEPYRAAAGPGGAWRGSGNQPIEVLTELGRHRFGDVADGAIHRVQIAVEDDDVWMIGVPAPGDLVELEHLLADLGVDLERASWRP